MNSWYHCNKCFQQGSSNGNFWFTSCGHILCLNCLKLGGAMPGKKGPCIVCEKPDVHVMEINRSMRPDILLLFRQPKDLVTEYAQRLKTAVDFQSGQSQRLIKHLQEKLSKTAKYARAAHAEIAKKIQQEQQLLSERNHFKEELDKSKRHTRELEKLLAERDQELHRLQQEVQRNKRRSPYQSPHKHRSPRKSPHKKSPYKKKRDEFGFPSLNGNTPLTTLSFLGCATSTPYEHLSAGRNPPTPATPFENLFNTPQMREDILVSGPPSIHNAVAANTPALLGLGVDKCLTLKRTYF